MGLAQFTGSEQCLHLDRQRTQTVGQRLLGQASRLDSDLALAPFQAQLPDRDSENHTLSAFAMTSRAAASSSGASVSTQIRQCVSSSNLTGTADRRPYLGQLLAAGGDILPAYRNAPRACELAPDDARCWSDRGRVY
jgi:Flp pilus assembly protein TadD